MDTTILAVLTIVGFGVVGAIGHAVNKFLLQCRPVKGATSGEYVGEVTRAVPGLVHLIRVVDPGTGARALRMIYIGGNDEAAERNARIIVRLQTKADARRQRRAKQRAARSARPRTWTVTPATDKENA